jgi:predicted dinucleotide-binding enzyme
MNRSTTSSAVRIAIIGAGNVGGGLARGWAASGYAVTLGVRDPAASDVVKGGVSDAVQVTDVATAVADADVIVLATPARVTADALAPVRTLVTGRIVVDATNPLGAGLQLQTGPAGESHAELLQAQFPEVRIVKCFNQTGAGNMPYSGGPTRPVMFVAGDDPSACTTVASLAEALGFEAIQAGALTRARELERLAMLWIALSASPAAGVGRNFVFTLQRG